MSAKVRVTANNGPLATDDEVNDVTGQLRVEYEESCRGWFQAASSFSLMRWRVPCLSGLRVAQKQKEQNAANAKLAKRSFPAFQNGSLK